MVAFSNSRLDETLSLFLWIFYIKMEIHKFYLAVQSQCHFLNDCHVGCRPPSVYLQIVPVLLEILALTKTLQHTTVMSVPTHPSIQDDQQALSLRLPGLWSPFEIPLQLLLLIFVTYFSNSVPILFHILLRN